MRSLLASRGVELPEGDATDAADAETVCGLGNRKNEVFSQVLADEGVEPYAGLGRADGRAGGRGASRWRSCRARRTRRPCWLQPGSPTASTSSSTARSRASRVCKGKPSGETYTYAAQLLKAPVERAVVVEDALSGVAAGRDGGFGLVVGVDRGAGRDALIEQGADIVVEDLAELVTR